MLASFFEHGYYKKLCQGNLSDSVQKALEILQKFFKIP